jgi:Ni/Fe-hydrogenase 1 B-type cytochrome subunit
MTTTVTPGRSTTEAPVPSRHFVWEFPIRLSHWTNALAILVLFPTGLFIAFPQLEPSGEPFQHFVMGRFRQFHFIFGYVLLFGLLLRFYWFLMGNNYARSGFPFVWRKSWWKAVFEQVLDYMHPARGRAKLGHSSLAGASYVTFLSMSMFETLTGFALYSESNPGGFFDRIAGWVIPLLGGSFRAHMWHHMVAWLIVVFVIVHIYIVLYDVHIYGGSLIEGIIAGPKYSEEGAPNHDGKWIS